MSMPLSPNLRTMVKAHFFDDLFHTLYQKPIALAGSLTLHLGRFLGPKHRTTNTCL